MDKLQAQKIIKDTFENSFDEKRFIYFIENLLNLDSSSIEDNHPYSGNFIPDAFKDYISTLKRIAKYVDGQNEMDVLICKLKKETSLEHARTMQRNFIAWYLNGSRGGKLKDAALVAFVSPKGEDWRFSLVKMDYRFEEDKGGRLKVKEEFTPARRWSFLVGANEKSHTAQRQLVDILANDEKNPTLAQLEEAFNIETVTKEFFEWYRKLFLSMKETLDDILKKDKRVASNFEANGVNTVDFAKKLLGQIIFLYFLQKKGWFGVARDNGWGTGSKHFLRELFEKKHGNYSNFFNDILEPLFYEALRIDRSYDDDYYSRFNCKIPFLNGGLFDPIGNYDWVHTDILLPNELFSNSKKTKEGDIGDGILDVFDRYNFTVKEDEPLEKEVAIDPELLGKAYEKFNAIRPDNYEEYKKALKSGRKGAETKFNKQYGVYYTPREIVHYMCQQSLIYYLTTELEGKAGKEDIEILIKYGEQVGEHEATVEAKGRETDTYSYKLPEGIRQNAKLIDEKLSSIKVCDPAIGSGAFPVGMMSQIVKVRNVLSVYIKDSNRTPYKFKRECIEKSLYGVDIDAGAVEIAKLRLWLSLVVDEEDIKQIRPLPNLDYKIVCGNSLLGYPYIPRGLEKIEKLKEQFFNETKPKEKNEIRQQINESLYELYKNTEKTLGYKVNFDFKINFSEVFREKGGFDIVIGNPPYGIKLQENDKRRLDTRFNQLNSPTKNSAIYFIYVSDAISCKNGINSLIVPKSLCYSLGWNKCASFLLPNLVKIIDCGKAFKQVKLEQVIIVQKKLNNDKSYVSGLFDGKNIIEFEKVEKTIFQEYNVLLTGQRPEEFQLIKKILNIANSKFGKYVSVKRGLNWQSLVSKFPGKTPIYRGEQLYPYYLAPATDFIDIDKFDKQQYEYQLRPKILNQLAIAHVQNPYPHFFLQATLDLENKLVFETISCTFVKDPKIDIRFLLAINNSKLFAWLLYKLIYSNAIRSTRYDEEYVARIPCPDFYKVNQQPFISLVDEILSITKDEDYLNNPEKQAKVKEYEHEIDNLVYKLYDLTPAEIEIIEGNIKKEE